jgi:hypothetical protein
MTKLTSLAGTVATSMALCFGAACNIHDNTINIPNATINATTDIDAQNVQPAAMVPIAVTVQNVYLIDQAATPPPEHVNDAGHIQVYMDDVDTMPLLITAMANFNVTIPPATKAGPHKLICRFHKHDGTPTTTKVEVAINVSATVTTGADGGVDVVTSVDANVTTSGSGGAPGSGGATGAGGGTASGAGGAGGAG